MIDEAGLHDELSAFVHVLTRHSQLSAVLAILVDRVPAVLEVCGAAALLVDGPRLRLAVASGPEVEGVERTQQRLGRGPAFDAWTTGADVRVGDLRCEARWPRFVEACASAGLATACAIPLRNATTVGVLDLYDAQPHPWTDDECAVAGLFADLTTCYAVNALEIDRQRHVVEQLETALRSRVVIEQAKGMVAATRHMTVDDAFAVLRKYANDRNETLRAVADAVVRDHLRP